MTCASPCPNCPLACRAFASVSSLHRGWLQRRQSHRPSSNVGGALLFVDAHRLLAGLVPAELQWDSSLHMA
eukprot:1857482-Rhodomonas_salina.1